ncbi:thioredoxin-like domain-containing protein, partial [Klebsiella pneumoniae]
FEDFFATMPWLALPFQDERKESLVRTFKVNGIPMVVAIGPTGRTVTTEARNLIMCHGADAYPFTPERLKEIEAQLQEKPKEDEGGNGEVDDQDMDEGEKPKGGQVCDGDVCVKG